MNVDIRTILLAATTASILQVVALVYLHVTNKKYTGIVWWAMGFLTVAAGYILIWLRESLSTPLISILLTNLLLLLSPAFQYIGLMRFLNKSISRPFVITILTLFVLSYIYFTFIDDNVSLRGIIISLALSVFSAAAAWRLYVNKTSAIATSAIFLSLVFFIYSAFYLVRTLIIIIGGLDTNIYDANVIQVFTFLISFVTGILVTFGYIILVNQRLNSEARQAKEHFEVIFKTFPDAAVITRQSDGKIINMNEDYPYLLGYEPDEVLEKTSLELHIWHDQEERRRFQDKLLKNGFISNFELTITKKDGSQFNGLVSARIITLDGVPCILSLTRNISELHKVTLQLKEANQMFSTVSNSSTALFWMSDLDRRHFWFNNTWLKFTGRSLEQEIGDGWQEHIHPDDLARWLKNSNEAFEKRLDYYQEFRLRHNDGAYRWVLVHGAPRYDFKGAFAGYIGTCFDITKRKLAEEQLKESEQKYRLLFESANDAIAVIQDTLFKFINPTMTRLLDCQSEDELIGRSFTEIIYPDDLSMVIENYRTQMQKISVPRYDFRLLTRNHEIKWVEINGVIIEWEGRPASLTFLTDITERKLAEEKLQESENKYRLLIETANESISVVQDELFKFVNPAMVKMLETKSGLEIIGKLITDYIHPDDRDTVLHNHRLPIKNAPVPPRYVFRVITGTGALKWVEISTVLIDWQGRPATLDFLTDITERKQAEQRQLLSSVILRILNEEHAVADTIEQILVAIKNDTGFDAVGVRLRNGEDFPYFVQKGFSSAFLQTENSLSAKDQQGVLCRDKNGKLSLECTCGLVLSGQTDPANPLFTKGGSAWTNDSLPILELPAEQDPRLHPRNQCINFGYQSLALIPIRTKDQIEGLLQLNDRRKNRFTPDMIEYFEGISASIGVAVIRKRNLDKLNDAYAEEKKLRRQLENEAKARMRFINVLAHELKGPLTPIMASSEMLKDELLKNNNTITQKLANNVVNGTQKLLNRLDELLDVARFARGAITLNLKPTNLRQFIEQAASLYEPTITQRNQKLLLEIKNDLPVAQIDPSRIEQVLINLLSNASKYSPEGSSIRLTAMRKSQELWISVQDEGIGISAEDQVSLFQPYQRLGHDQQKIEGLGLGLTVVKYIVETHGGKIWVESQLGRGSTFTFTIPLK